MDEFRAIEAVRAGQPEAFRWIVELHQERIYRVCVNVLGDAGMAEDLAQETFVMAYRKLNQFDATKGSLAVWLMTIARRLCSNERRKKRPLTLADGIDLPDETLEHLPDDLASRSDTFAALDRALTQLSEEQRRAFIFAEIEELPHEEIARIEGIAKGTVKSRISRAKCFLQGLLKTIYQEATES